MIRFSRCWMHAAMLVAPALPVLADDAELDRLKTATATARVVADAVILPLQDLPDEMAMVNENTVGTSFRIHVRPPDGIRVCEVNPSACRITGVTDSTGRDLTPQLAKSGYRHSARGMSGVKLKRDGDGVLFDVLTRAVPAEDAEWLRVSGTLRVSLGTGEKVATTPPVTLTQGTHFEAGDVGGSILRLESIDRWRDDDVDGRAASRGVQDG